jgi:hypothetical protein
MAPRDHHCRRPPFMYKPERKNVTTCKIKRVGCGSRTSTLSRSGYCFPAASTGRLLRQQQVQGLWLTSRPSPPSTELTVASQSGFWSSTGTSHGDDTATRCLAAVDQLLGRCGSVGVRGRVVGTTTAVFV